MLRRAAFIVWLVLSIGTAALLAAQHVLPETAILELSRLSRSPGHGNSVCPFCGMTRAFIAISHFHFQEADSLNRGSLLLYGGLVFNEIVVAFYLGKRSRAFGLLPRRIKLKGR